MFGSVGNTVSLQIKIPGSQTQCWNLTVGIFSKERLPRTKRAVLRNSGPREAEGHADVLHLSRISLHLWRVT